MSYGWESADVLLYIQLILEAFLWRLLLQIKITPWSPGPQFECS